MQLPCKSIHVSSVSMNPCVWSSQTMQGKGHCKMFLSQWCFSHIQNPAKEMNIRNGEARNSKRAGSGWTETSRTDPGPIQEALRPDNFLSKKLCENLTQPEVFYHLEVYEFSRAQIAVFTLYLVCLEFCFFTGCLARCVVYFKVSLSLAFGAISSSWPDTWWGAFIRVIKTEAVAF